MKKTLLLLTCIAFASFLPAQVPEKKQTTAYRTASAIRIDGHLDEPDWSLTDVAREFIQKEPKPGVPSPFLSEVRLLYDDGALYVGATLFDPAPDSILKELSPRDELGNTDLFGLMLDTYRDGINAFGFWVTPAGIQGDERIFSEDDDDSWDAVWESSARITEEGWTVEMRIPYSAIRFPVVEEQKWAVNFARYVRRVREESWWNAMNPELDNEVSQCGLLDGIRNIESPIRLSVTPYVAGYFQVRSGGGLGASTTRSFRGGLDLKYGISDAFTLDMTLIPDFGQVQSDDQVYNFTPFEVQFAENRQFFTEGTELFRKGGLFYSRRIGGVPIGFSDVFEQVDSTQTIVSNPTEAQLINAMKVSGRTRKNLGIGIFNALEARSFAEVRDESGEAIFIQTQPLTNYNVFVLDQGLKNNSYAAVINTSAWREGASYDANVVGTDILLRDKPNKYAVSLLGAMSSQFFPDSTHAGFKYRIVLQRTSGKLTGALRYYVENHTYDPNDLGFLQSNNIKRITAQVNYNIYQPFSVFNKVFNSLIVTHARLYEPNLFRDFSVNASTVLIFKNFHAAGGGIETQPVEGYDHFEPRVPGRYYVYPPYFGWNGWISSDYRRQFAFDVRANHWWHTERDGFPRWGVWFDISPRFRVNDHLSFITGYNQTTTHNDVGFATITLDTIVFGRREQRIIETWVTAKYIFNHLTGLSLRARHYWARAQYDEFFQLTELGKLSPIGYSGKVNGASIHDVDFNALTVDVVFSWFFAPGSEMSIVWKNAIFKNGDMPAPGYGRNFGELLAAPQLNSLSVKLLYYLDYLKAKQIVSPG